MAYDPTVWKSGDTITSAKLNKLENCLAEASGGGTGGGVLVANDENGTLDKTWLEIATAIGAGTLVVIPSTNEYDGKLVGAGNCRINNAIKEPTGYMLYTDCSGKEIYAYIATSADGYPVANDD